MIFKGIIIEESLNKKDVLGRLKIKSTKIEPVIDKHKTSWLKQWTLHTVEVSEGEVETIAKEISECLELEHPWYADFKNESIHFIIFLNKVFKIDRTSKEEYNQAREYGLLLGIPSHQVDFHPEVKAWER